MSEEVAIITAGNALHADPKFVLELAAGLEPAQTIASRYGYTGAQWLQLEANPFFIKAVDTKRADLKANGYVFRTKCAVAAEDLLEDVYLESKKDEATLPQKLESLKFFTKAAGLEPKDDKAGSGLAGFSLTIVLDKKTVTVTNDNIVDAEVVNDS